jgi:hypothetical protein
MAPKGENIRIGEQTMLDPATNGVAKSFFDCLRGLRAGVPNAGGPGASFFVVGSGRASNACGFCLPLWKLNGGMTKSQWATSRRFGTVTSATRPRRCGCLQRTVSLEIITLSGEALIEVLER